MLPHEGKDVNDLLKSLDREDIFELFNKLEPLSLHVSIPRTTIDSSVDMVQIMQKVNLGINEFPRLP